VGRVLTLTPTAAEVVRTLVDQSESPDSGGLRIAASDGAPEATDATVEQAGATVYLDPGAAELLDDKLLDAQVADDHVTFVLREDDDGDEDGPFRSFSMDEDPHQRRNGNGPH
jgi:Fe-S cluster assembly iron-binding protein IscA